ncbi:MAG: hypothetical protein AAGG11_04295 [Pseudomonadota bacterium]
MPELQMPAAREFGWDLRPTSSSRFEILKRPNGQFCVVLNHALLRGVTAEMIHWWFLNFPNLRVRLIDVPGYEQQQVPAYLLWHPVDHRSATLSGRLGPNNTSRVGARLHIQEAMQYDRYGWQYPVDTTVKLFYVGEDGWAMGRAIPLLGPVMMLRIHFTDVVQDGVPMGVHYHYEVVIGVSGDGPVSRLINSRITAQFGPEFFAAWHRHNVIEVGVFENFLPPLYAQRERPDALEYQRDMDPQPLGDLPAGGFDGSLFERRITGYRSAQDPHAFQAYAARSFL